MPGEEAELLAAVEDWRGRCIALRTRLPIEGPLYKALGGIMESIDGIAEAVTGDRTQFWTKPHSVPGPKVSR